MWRPEGSEEASLRTPAGVPVAIGTTRGFEQKGDMMDLHFSRFLWFLYSGQTTGGQRGHREIS